MGKTNGSAANKEWTVKFNAALAEETVNASNIYVVDAAGNRVETALRVNGSVVCVSPPAGGYIPGETYTLYITSGVAGKNGRHLNRAVSMEFTIEFSVDSGARHLTY